MLTSSIFIHSFLACLDYKLVIARQVLRAKLTEASSIAKMDVADRFEDEAEYDPMQLYMPSYLTPRQITNGRSRFNRWHESSSSQFSRIPLICHSAPLLPARDTNRESREAIADSRLEYVEQHCSYHQTNGRVYREIRLRAITSKRILGLSNVNSSHCQQGDTRYLPSSASLPTEGYVKLALKSSSTVMRNSSNSVEDDALTNCTFGKLETKLSTLHNGDEMNDSMNDKISDRKSSSASSAVIRYTKMMLILAVLLLCLYFPFHPPSSKDSELDQKVPLEKLVNDFLIQIQSSLYGQHIAVQSIAGGFRHALVNKDTKVVTLLLMGPSGSGKSFTRTMLQDAVIQNGFAVARINHHHHRPNFTEICMSWKFYQNLAIFVEDIGRGFQDEWRSGDVIMDSKQCLGFNKILLVIVSSVFKKEIKEYMFSQCKFKDERLSIQTNDVIAYISKSKGLNLDFDSHNERHAILPLIFLPLDIDHVKMCILRVLSSFGVTKQKQDLITNDVINLMEFYPQCGMKYSESGCKLVDSRVKYIINRKR